MKTILLTGVRGYLGQEISHFFLNNPDIHFVPTSHQGGDNILACNLLDKKSVDGLLEDYQPDIIIHAAAIVPKSLVDYNNQDVQTQNLQMIDNLCSDFTGKFIFCSSMTVYSEDLPMPVDETIQSGNNLSAYGYGKVQAEEKIRSYKNIDFLILRLTGLFGESRKAGLIYNMIQFYKNEEPLSLPEKPLMWAASNVKKVAEIIYELSLIEDAKGILNIGSHEIYSLNHLNKIIANYFGKKELNMIEHPKFQMDVQSSEQYIKEGFSFENEIRDFCEKC